MACNQLDRIRFLGDEMVKFALSDAERSVSLSRHIVFCSRAIGLSIESARAIAPPSLLLPPRIEYQSDLDGVSLARPGGYCCTLSTH